MRTISRYGIVFQLIIILSILNCSTISAQKRGTKIKNIAKIAHVEDSTKRKKIEIINTDVFEFITTDSNTIRFFTDNVIFNHKGTDFYSNKATQYMDTEIVIAEGDVHIHKPDSFDIWSDHLVYYSKEKLAEFRGNVIFKDTSAQLLTDSLDYDMNTDIGLFWGGGTFITDSSTLTSEEGIYYQNKDEAFFYGNVHLANPDFDLYADSMRYDTKEEIAYFIAATKIINDGDVIHCTSGFYDTKTNKAQFGGNTKMKSGTAKISANELVYEKSIGYGEARGNVIWEDTVEQITILSNYSEYKDSLSYVMATDDPLMIDVTDGDTLYLSADTLITYKLPYYHDWNALNNQYEDRIDNSELYYIDSLKLDTLIISSEAFDSTQIADSFEVIDSSNFNLVISSEESTMDSNLINREKDSVRVFHAFKDTKILSGRISGICDSLYFTTQDSIFRMTQSPMAWVDTTQFSGDSIHLLLKNKVLDRIFIYQNAMIIHENVIGVYDQTKGKTVEGFFKEDRLTKMEIFGNGESIYFIKDDSSAFVGGNKSICSKMIINMVKGENEVDHITFITKPEATFTPFRMINLSTYKLDGFTWQFEKKTAKCIRHC